MTVMTRQEIFDKVALHLLTQGKRSENEYGCMYRGDEGRMCAAGCLIKEEDYDNDLENKIVSADDVYEALTCSGVFERDIYDQEKVELLLKLQDMHDTRNPDIWAIKLRDAAEKFGISADVVTGFRE